MCKENQRKCAFKTILKLMLFKVKDFEAHYLKTAKKMSHHVIPVRNIQLYSKFQKALLQRESSLLCPVLRVVLTPTLTRTQSQPLGV